MMSSTACGASRPVILPHHTWSAAWCCAARSPGTIAVPDEWSIGSMLHYSRTVAVCPHVLQALIALHARTSYRPMMDLTSGTLQTYTRALGTCKPSYTAMPIRLFFMFEARGPQGTIWRVTAQSPPSREAGYRAVGQAAQQSPPSGSVATVHVAASEPSLTRRRDPEPLDTWQPRSPPWLGGRVRYCKAHGSAWLHARSLSLLEACM
jgi:hypothetical protein